MAGQRRVIVGVIGGDGQMATSVALGRAIAEREWILLTGGRVLPRAAVLLKGEVKDGSMLGADEAAASKARLIGILPANEASEPRWDYAQGSRRFFLHTGRPHYIRNVINGLTPDVMAAFGGSRGTLAEIAFAMGCGRQVVFLKGSLERLRQKFREHFKESDEANENRRLYLEEPTRVYPNAVGTRNDAGGLISMLEAALWSSREAEDAVAALSAAIGSFIWRNKDTGFPSMPGDRTSKQRFETLVQAISQ